MASSNLVNGNDVATFVLDTQAPYNILDFDQGLCVMTGYSPREVSKKICTLDNLLYVEDYNDTIASINHQLSISNLISVQHRIVTKNGTILTVLCNGQAFSLNDGRDVLQCVFTDITNLESAASESEKAKTDLEVFANTVPSGVSKHKLDKHLSLVWANNYFYQLSGYTSRELKQDFHLNTLSLVHKDDLSMVLDTLELLTEDNSSQIINFRISCKSSGIKWVNAVFARSGEYIDDIPVVNLVLSDITNLKIAEIKASLEEQKYLIIADISEELPYEYDIENDVIKFADKFKHIFEGDSIIENPAETMPKNALVSYDTKDSLIELFSLARTGVEYHAAEFKLNTKNGGYQWYFSTCSTIYDEDKRPIRLVGLLRNIHTQKIEQEQLVARAERDLMTNLYNKATTETKIKACLRELNSCSYCALLLVDIDDFKKINDTYGHLKGDEVIIEIARTLLDIKGDYGIAGRLGGDEFCLFLTNVLDTELVCEKALNIASLLREKYPGDNGDCRVTLSIGIATTNEPLTYNALLENADTALYQAKLKGKNCYSCYSENMSREQYVNNREASPKVQNDKLIHDIMDTLFRSPSLYLGIENTLELIGSNYDIDKICIWEYTDNRDFIDCTHQWCKDSIYNDKQTREHTPATMFTELDSMNTDGFVYSSDTSLIKLNSSLMSPESEGIKRLVQSQILSDGKIIGYVSIYSMNMDSIWSAADLSAFKSLFRLLGEAVASKQNLKSISALRDELTHTFDLLPTPMIVADRDSYTVLYHNPAALEHYPGLSTGQKCHLALYDEAMACRECPLHRLNDDASAKYKRYDKIYEEEQDELLTPVSWAAGTNAFLISLCPHKQTKAEKLRHELETNITIEKRIAEASYKDIITGHGNFEKFKLDGQRILDENPNTDYVMFYFNIKNFKYINEAYGHAIGDRTIKTVADVIAKYLQSGEAFSRVISDTFILLIHYNSKDHFMNVFNSIKNEVHDACRVIQNRFTVDFTTGILIIDETMHDYGINKLVDRAIMAGKSIASTRGATFAFYDDEYHKQVLNEAQIENNMYGALENSEFCAYAQPKYDITTNALIGAELLVRWMSPSKGFLEPAAFIPFFEKNGFIFNIDCFMLEEACKSLRKYLDNDIYVLPFSVNISRITLANPGFLDKVQELVDKYFIPHHYLEFEITESVFTEDYETMIETLKQLKAMDFVINMDDFGTGYSSLTLLRDLPIDVIKLDHDFLARSAAKDKNATYILKSIIDMAKALDIRVVSEGIETSEQLDMLKSINCEIGQGFLFAKPMPIDDYDTLITKYSEI